MYCKTCGISNSEESNYCIQDGTALVNSPSMQQMQLVTGETSFCSDCGQETEGVDNYCSSCGHSLQRFIKTAEEKKTTFIPIPKGTRSLASGLTTAMLKKIWLPAVIAFAVMLGLNYLAYISMDEFEDGYVAELSDIPLEMFADLADEVVDTSIKEPDKLFGFSDQVMMSHTLSPNYHAKITSNVNQNDNVTAELKLSYSTVLYILIPILSIFAGGIVYRRQNTEISLRSFLSGAIGIGLIYSIVLSIFSLFSGYNYLYPSQGTASVDIGTSYSFVETFIKTLLFGIIFSFIGMMFSINYRKVTSHLESLIPYGHAIHQGFSAFVRGFVSLTVIMVIIMLTKVNVWKTYVEDFGITYIPSLIEKTTSLAVYAGVQIASFIYSMLHFVPISLNSETLDESNGIEYSIFSGFTASGEATSDDYSSLNFFFSLQGIDLYLKLAVLLPIILLLFAGYSMAKANQSTFKSLAVFSLVYSLFAAALASFSGFHINVLLDMKWLFDNDSNNLLITLAVNTFRVFLNSFIMAYLAGLVGSYLSKRLQSKKK